MDTPIAPETEAPASIEIQRITLISPRPIWLEFCLHFFCFGMYTNIWLVRKVREFNRINNESYTPWLWFFVSFFPIANLIAFPKFIRSLHKLETEAKLEKWNGWNGIWLFCVFVLSVLFNLINQYEVKNWMLILILLIWATLFCVLNNRIDKAKIKIERLELKPNRFVFNAVEMVFLLIGVPLILFVIYMSLSTEIFTAGKRYKADETFQSQTSGYKFKIIGDGWRQVDVGSHASGDAVVEFSGPLQDMYIIVFSPTQGSSISNMVYTRLSNYDASYNCKHSHEFNQKGTGVIARISCTSTYAGDPAIDISTFIETDKGIYEMYGHFSSSKKTYADYKVKFISMVEGFEPL